MIKLLMFFEEKPNALNEEGYTKFVHQTYKIFEECKKTGDLIQYKVFTSVLESPSKVSETEWKSLSAWAKFWESKEYQHVLKSGGQYLQSFKTYILHESSGP